MELCIFTINLKKKKKNIYMWVNMFFYEKNILEEK